MSEPEAEQEPSGSSSGIRKKPDTMSPAETIVNLPVAEGDEGLRRRLTYLMAFRVLLITLVMGATTLLYWLGDVDLTQTNSLILYGIIASTYVLTLLYARALRRTTDHRRLAAWQLAGDLAIATIIVHITGGAQSAYTFFYPLAVIGSAVVRYRKGAIIVSLAAIVLFVGVAYLGWIGVIPTAAGQKPLPTDMKALAFGRAMALNLVAIAAIGTMAVQLARQLQQSSVDLAVHQSATADLLTLHEDIVRCLTSGLVTVDVSGKVLTINDAASDILDCDAASGAGRSLKTLAPGLAALLDEFPIEEEARRGEVTHQSETGEQRVLGVSISPLVDHKSLAVGRIVNFQDLTEVRKLEEQMQRAERLTVIGTLAAGIAHEIRNPLASISGSIELLGSDPSADEDSKALMNIVTREIERLNSLITELLDYANPREPNAVDFDLCEVLRDTLRVFAQNAKFSKVEVNFEGDDGERELILRADPEKIRQLIWNLLRNGAEAAIQSGQKLWVQVQAGPDHASLLFRDNGPGIPHEVLDKVFDPFFTTKAKGSGLGLATVHSTVMDHRGTITVESDGSTGACFRVRLPYHREHDA